MWDRLWFEGNLTSPSSCSLETPFEECSAYCPDFEKTLAHLEGRGQSNEESGRLSSILGDESENWNLGGLSKLSNDDWCVLSCRLAGAYFFSEQNDTPRALR